MFVALTGGAHRGRAQEAQRADPGTPPSGTV